MIAEDREYIHRVLSGEASAFDGLVRKYNRMAGAIAYAIVGDFEAAQDVVQDSFLKAYRALETLRDLDKFKVWLADIVRSKAIDWLRRKKSFWALPFSQALPEGFEGDEDSTVRPIYSNPPVEEAYARQELRDKVLEAIRSLPEDDRIVVALKHMEGLSYREIAEITRTTVSSVESRLFRARQTLRKKLERILR